jgi:D-arabinitol 4-dehydrogenase
LIDQLIEKSYHFFDSPSRPACGTLRTRQELQMASQETSQSPYDHVIVHIGSGAFHRAHQAWYLNRLHQLGDTRWSLAIGNIRADMQPVLQALARQNGVYTLETVTPAGLREYETIRSIKRVIPWEADLASLVAAGAAPECKIISFTVTEGGYYLDEHHRLERGNADVRADLEGARTTIYGTLAAVLAARMAAQAGPVTLLNCDNLRSNGERFRAGLLEFLQLTGQSALYDWTCAHTTSPDSMVDRITPRSNDALKARVKQATGFDDACPVMGENFIQWVIEDNFCAGRPAWENAGAEMVASVMPYEEAKIRILNASHSCIAWAGTLIGLDYIHQGTADAAIRRMALDYVSDDVIACLSPSPIDLPAYRDVVLARFGNPYIQDTNQRVAADGYSKIPGFIAPTLRECLARGAQPSSTAMLPALFFVFLQRWHEGVLPYTYQDGVMDPAAAHALFAGADPLAAFCADQSLWGSLAGQAVLHAAIAQGVARVHAWLAAYPKN